MTNLKLAGISGIIWLVFSILTTIVTLFFSAFAAFSNFGSETAGVINNPVYHVIVGTFLLISVVFGVIFYTGFFTLARKYERSYMTGSVVILIVMLIVFGISGIISANGDVTKSLLLQNIDTLAKEDPFSTFSIIFASSDIIYYTVYSTLGAAPFWLTIIVITLTSMVGRILLGISLISLNEEGLSIAKAAGVIEIIGAFLAYFLYISIILEVIIFFKLSNQEQKKS